MFLSHMLKGTAYNGLILGSVLNMLFVNTMLTGTCNLDSLESHVNLVQLGFRAK